MYITRSFLKRQELHRSFVYGILNRLPLQRSKADEVLGAVHRETKEMTRFAVRSNVEKKLPNGSVTQYGSEDDDVSDSKWGLELAWLTKALEPALQLFRRGAGVGNNTPASGRSVAEIIASIQRSKIGIQDWSLSDLTIGLVLIYLRQASTNPLQDIKGVQVLSDTVVQDLIYHIELAKGCYKDSASSLSRSSMLRESNILKFVRNSSVMRPGYYIGVDTRKKLVILGIRGTHTVYDIITDIVSSSNEEVTFEGYSTHFGTTEAARWFLNHEVGMIRKYLEKYEGFRLRLVGHSLGGAIASLLASMLRKKSSKELGFSPDIVSAVGFATPPCVSRELAESCSDYVSTLVMQDDIIPRLSVASLKRLRNEIIETDWMSVVEKEDWKSVKEFVTNAKQVVSSVQDAARKLADYAKLRGEENSSDISVRKEASAAAVHPLHSKAASESGGVSNHGGAPSAVPEELFVPGTVYYLKRNFDTQMGSSLEYFTLWKRHPDEHFQRIVLSSNIISDHKCESHYYALRDVLKGLPGSSCEEGIFN